MLYLVGEASVTYVSYKLEFAIQKISMFLTYDSYHYTHLI